MSRFFRHLLQTFFFPNDYTERPASHMPQAGERRVYTSMDITVRLTSQGSFNIPFHDRKDVGHVLYMHCRCMYLLFKLQKLHQIGLSLEEGSEVKVHQPWVTNDDGYTTSVTGTLKSVVVTSDLSFPHLARANTLQVLLGVCHSCTCSYTASS